MDSLANSRLAFIAQQHRLPYTNKKSAILSGIITTSHKDGERCRIEQRFYPCDPLTLFSGLLL